MKTINWRRPRMALGIAAFFLLGQTAAQALEFEAGRFFPAGVNPYQLTVADFDRDGNLDVAVVNSGVWPSGFGSLTVFLGDGLGGLASAGNYGTGRIAVGIETGDLNNDGWADLVVVNRQPFINPGTFQVFLNSADGTGSFALANTVNCGYQPMHAALGHLNGDAYLDVAVAVHSENRVRMFAGDGAGGFAETFAPIGTGAGPNGIAIGDLNFLTDSLPDIVTSNWWGYNVTVILGHVSGVPAYQTTQGIGRRSWTVGTADVNGDGFEDVVAPNAYDGTVSVVIGYGDGTFASQVVTSLGVQAYDFDVADIDLDGYLDFVTGHSGNGVKVFRGDGTARFLTPALPTPASPAASQAFPCVRVADFNKDGFPDLVATENGASNGVESISLFLQVPNLRPEAVLVASEELVSVGQSVALDASSSSDNEGDALSYEWTLESVPAGSVASIVGSNTVSASFTPDLPGVYRIALTVSDYIGPGETVETEILALSLPDFALFNVEEAATVANELSMDAILQDRRLFWNRLRTQLHLAEVFIDQTDAGLGRAEDAAQEALAELRALELRLDGCSDRGAPDVTGSGFAEDWVTDCVEQEALCAAIRAAIGALESVGP